MTPYRVPKRQTAVDLMQDLQSWRNFGVEKDARQTHPWQCQAAMTRRNFSVADSHQADAAGVGLCVYSDLEGEG